MTAPSPAVAPHVASNVSAMNAASKKKTKAGKNKKDAVENAPIFLRKTYHMIDTCDPSIATWSDDGTKFVVKDPEKFASDVIPQFFKHNNFSSFVRQLNFYGFRKIKTDPIKITNAEDEAESKYWRFRHEKFQRGRPDLLGEIRKANQTESPDKQEVDALKNEVKDLKGRIASMTGDIERLTSLVHTMVDNGVHDVFYSPDNAKKRKVHPESKPYFTSSVNGAPDPTVKPMHVSSLPDPSRVTDADLLMEDKKPYHPGSLPPVKPTGRFDSVGSLNSMDNDFLGDLFADHFDPNEDFGFLEMAVPDEMSSMKYPIVEKAPKTEKPAHPPNPELVKKLHDSLAALPPQMQELFVERLIETIAHPESFKNQVEAVTALAGAAVEEAKKKMKNGSDKEETPEMSVPLAAATLGAFLTNYASAMENKQSEADTRPSIVPMEG